ncbi:MAG: energy-coupling factor transporter transmembrane protein EcfT [Desulfotalea sp.]
MPKPERNNSVSNLYVHRETWLHKLHPFNKLVYVLLIGVTAYLGPDELYFKGGIIALNLSLAIGCEIFKETWNIAWRILLPLALFMIMIHGTLYPGNQTIILSLGQVHFYQEGFLFALNVLMQLTAVLTASLLFVLCTHPVDLVTAISQAGLPNALAYLIGSPLLLLPIMRLRIGTIQAAQRSRGLDSEGNIVKRFFSLFPLLAPLVLGSLVEIEQRSIAMEIRGFNAPYKKTSLRKISDSRWQQLLRWAMLVLAVFVIIFRLWN